MVVLNRKNSFEHRLGMIGEKSATPKRVVAVLQLGTGHMNPLFAIIAELIANGNEVFVFGESNTKELIEAVGGKFLALYSHVEPVEGKTSEETVLMKYQELNKMPLDFSLVRAKKQLLTMPAQLHVTKELNPDVILHDSFCLHGPVFSEVLGIPHVAVLPYPGMGVFGDAQWSALWGHTQLEALDCEAGKALRQEVIDTFNVDPFEKLLPGQYTSEYLTLVNTIEEMCHFLDPEKDKTSFQYYKEYEKNQVCVGPLLHPTARFNGVYDGDLTSNPALEKLTATKDRRIIYFSLGTVLVGKTKFWNLKTGISSAKLTGKQYYLSILKALVATFQDDETFQKELAVVVNVGQNWEEVKEQFTDFPPNFYFTSSVKQLDFLEHVDVYICHMGANSTFESILQGVPMLPVPAFGDQYKNAELAIKNGVGFAAHDIKNTFATIGEGNNMRQALEHLLYDSKVRESCDLFAKKMSLSAGRVRAAKAIALL